MKNNFKLNIVICLIFTILFFNVPTVYADEDKDKNDVDPYYCVLCDHLDEDDPLYEKEKQFDLKVSIIKSIYGKAIDPVALVGTVLKEYNSSATLYKEEYDEKFNSDRYTNALREYKSSGLGSKLQLTQEDVKKVAENAKIDLLTLTAIIMADSNHLNTYNDVCYRDALAGNSLVGNTNNSGAFVFLMNGLYCGLYDIVENPIQFVIDLFSGDNYSVSAASAKNRSVLTKNVCENGFIGGIYSEVLNIKDEAARNQQKLAYADDIMLYINQYRLLHGQDISNNTCASNTALSTGEYAEWKQYDAKWGNISLGSSSLSIRNAGCLATSVSIQVARSGTQLGSLPSGFNEFNPGAFVTSLNQNGGFTSGGLFTWSGYGTIAPHWKNNGGYISLNTSSNQVLADTISKELETGAGEGNKYQKFIVIDIHYTDKNGEFHPQHWIAINGVEDGVVKTFDPGRAATTLDEAYPSWGVEGYRVFYADDVLFGQTGTSNSGSSCGTGGSLDGLVNFLGYVEGATPCNYRGQGEETGYLASALNDGMGYTAAFGLTYYMEPYAKQVGYNDFIADKDGPTHCNSKEYIDKMVPLAIEGFMNQVDSYAEAKQVNLTEVQRHALTSVAHGGGAFEEYVIDAMVNHSAESDEVLEAFKKTYNPSDSSYRYGLGLRRMAEYEMFVTGNYNAAKPFDLFNSDSEIQAASKSLVQKNWPTSRDIFVWDGSVTKSKNTTYGIDDFVCIDGQAVRADDTGSYSSLPVTCAKTDGTTRVLFAGNSRTFESRIDQKFKGFVEGAGYSVEIAAPVKPDDGGKTLNEFLNTNYNKVNKSYDCVVLQEQSYTYVNNYSEFNSGVKNITDVVKNKNNDVKTYVRQTWTTKNFDNLNKAYSNASKAAEANGAYIIKDGKSFEKSHSSYPSINLFTDSIHQSNAGAYLSAACIYKTLYGKSPVGSSYTGGLNSEDAEKLQKIADSVCEVPKTSSTGMGKAVVDLALKQLSEDGSKFWNYVIGGGFVNGNRTPWCACFVTWVLDHASYNNSPVKNIIDVRAGGKTGAGAGGYLEYAHEHGMLKYNDSCSMYTGKNGSKYTPKAGDLVIFSWDSDWNGVPSSNAPGHDHIGIVEKAEGGTLYTVEGNSSDAVRQRNYSLSNCQVSAFVSWEK